MEHPADAYRMQKIIEIQKLLETEITVRENLYRKYQKGVTWLFAADTTLVAIGVVSTTASVGLLASVVGAPAALPIQAIGVVAGLLGGVGKFVERKFSLKAKKHNDITILAKAKLGTVIEKVGRALEDEHISDAEFKAISADYSQYLTMKENIRQASSTADSNDKEENKKMLFAQATGESVRD